MIAVLKREIMFFSSIIGTVLNFSWNTLSSSILLLTLEKCVESSAEINKNIMFVYSHMTLRFSEFSAKSLACNPSSRASKLFFWSISRQTFSQLFFAWIFLVQAQEHWIAENSTYFDGHHPLKLIYILHCVCERVRFHLPKYPSFLLALKQSNASFFQKLITLSLIQLLLKYTDRLCWSSKC